MEQDLLELEHSIGYTGKYQNTVHFHPTLPDTILYSNGGLLVVESIHDKHQQQFLRGHDMEITSIEVSQSATGQLGTIFQKNPDAPVILWDFSKKEPLAVLKGIQIGVKKLAFSPDDRFLAAIGENNVFIIWDTKDGSAIHTKVSEFPISLLCWGEILRDQNPKHPSYTLITANTTTIFINALEYDLASMQYFLKVGTCQLPSSGLVRNYTFSLIDGDQLYAGTQGGEVCVFSIYSKIYKATMPLSSNGLLCIANMDNFLFIGGGEGKVKKIDVAGGRWNLTHEAQIDGKVTSISLNNDRKELIVGTTSGKLYRMLTGDLSFMIHTDAHSGCINDIDFGERSDQFASIDENGFVKVWDSSEYKTVFTATPNKQSQGTAVCISNNDGILITGWRDGFIRAYDIVQKVSLWEIANAHRGAVTVLYADVNYLLSGGQDGTVRVWDRANRRMLIQFSDHKKDVQALFPDAQKPHLIHSCGQDRSICTYDLKAEKKIVSHQTNNGSLFGMSQRKDNEFELVTCGQGAPLYFWDCDESNPVAEIGYPYKVLTVQVSPSGRFVAYGTETNEVYVYSMVGLNEFKCLAKGLGHSGPVFKLKWAPDEKQIISVSTDSSICVWNFYA